MASVRSDKGRTRRPADQLKGADGQLVPWEDAGRIIRDIAGLKATDRVLEVPCRSGRLAFDLAAYCAYVTGVDRSEDKIALASERAIESGADNVSFQVGDAVDLEFADGVFDRVFCRFALHHFEDPVEALRQLARVVKSPGYLIVADIVSSEDAGWRETHNKIERSRDPTHVSLLSPRQLRAALDATGVIIESEAHWQARQRFRTWMRRIGADRTALERTRRLLQDAAKKKTSDLDIAVRGQAIEFTQRWMVWLALKLT